MFEIIKVLPTHKLQYENETLNMLPLRFNILIIQIRYGYYLLYILLLSNIFKFICNVHSQLIIYIIWYYNLS